MKSQATSPAMSSDLTFITNEQGQRLGDRFYALTPDEIKIVEAAAMAH